MVLFRAIVRLDDVEDILADFGVHTIGLSKVKGTRREYFVECITLGEFVKAIVWTDEMKNRFDGFEIHPMMQTDLRYEA